MKLLFCCAILISICALIFNQNPPPTAQSVTSQNNDQPLPSCHAQPITTNATGSTKKTKMVSWIEYEATCEFPIQNLPYGVFTTADNTTPRIAVALGDYAIDLSVLAANKAFPCAEVNAAFQQPTLNGFMALSKPTWTAVRQLLTNFFTKGHEQSLENAEYIKTALVKLDTITMHLPATIGDYTDFYASKNHAYNVGVMFRGPDNALQPNWTWLPVGYHGRASSVVISGTDLHRPRGQLTGPTNQPPAVHGACKNLDFELELGFFIGTGNKLGHPINVNKAKDHIFGVVLLNDWSARDIQKWEYVPLGPFGAKNFGTTISPWIVTYDALEPFFVQPAQEYDPEPLPYLQEKDVKNVLDIQLDVLIAPHENPAKEYKLLSSNSKYLYWSPQQMLAHHTVTGCNMNSGDLIGSGTISGKSEAEYGSLLELNWKGSKTIELDENISRKFIQDNDAINIKGRCVGEGYVIGFGDCKGKILPPVQLE